MEQGLITFFDITDCGFYRIRQGNKSEHIEGDLANTIDFIRTWIDSRDDVEQTIPWDVKANPNRTQIYCKSIDFNSNNGDCIFVLWKRYGEEDGKINGILAKSKVDDKNVDTHKVSAKSKGEEVFLGDPMYYWFIPEHNLFASIKFPHSTSDTDKVLQYIKKCMDLRVRHPRKKITQNTTFNQLAGKDIVTQSVTYRSIDDRYSMTYRFHGKMKELSIEGSDMETLARDISHIVVRETIAGKKAPEKHPVFALYDKVTNNNVQVNMRKQVEIISAEYFTKERLQNTLKVYNEEFDPKSEWDNVGFKINGKHNTTKWFNSYVQRKVLLMNPLDKKDDSYYPAGKLARELANERESLISFAEYLADKANKKAVN